MDSLSPVFWLALSIVRPVLLSATAMLGLTAANQEFVLPQIATYLLYPRDDPNGSLPCEPSESPGRTAGLRAW